MLKFLVILIVGLVLEAAGVAFLSKGLKALGEFGGQGPADWLRWVGRGATQPWLLLGVAMEAVFFGILLYLLAQRDVTLVWPLTSLGFVLTAVMARYILKEEVSGMRWAGVILIVAGAALVSWSEHRKPSLPPSPGGQSLQVEWGEDAR